MQSQVYTLLEGCSSQCHDKSPSLLSQACGLCTCYMLGPRLMLGLMQEIAAWLSQPCWRERAILPFS